MSLLGKLIQLHAGSVPLEDFFTEAVGHLLTEHPVLCRQWLKKIGLDEVSNDQHVFSVNTQRSFRALEHHLVASRPDIEVKLSGGFGDTGIDVIFVESKISSGEGPGQLKRYAEHLADMGGAGRRTLLYVTRDYDPKEPKEVIGEVGGAQESDGVRFVQSRWSEFYQSLAEYQTSLPHKGSDLIAEVIAFMEEQGMAREYRLSGADLEALSRMPRALGVMEETIASAAGQLQQLVGRRPKQYGTAARFVREYGLYSAVFTLGMDESWQCGLGYALNPDFITRWLGLSQSDYPALRVYLHIPPQTADRAERVAAMREMAERWGWKAQNLRLTETNSEIMRVKSLADIIPEEDHIAAIEKFFVESAAELAGFRDNYPHLPWETALST